MKSVITIIFALVLTSVYATGWGDSIFSINGLGEISYPVDGQARGMGGITLAFLEGRGVSFINPAIVGAVDTTTVTAVFLFEQRKVKDSTSRTNIYSWGPKFMRLVVPISHGFVIGGGIAPYSDVNFHLRDTGLHLGSDTGTPNEPYTLHVSADGGTRLGSVTLAKNFGNRLYFGLCANFLFGSITQEWRRDFSNSEFEDSDDLYDTHYFGQIYCGGIALRPHRRWTFGFLFSRSGTIEATTERSSVSGTMDQEKNELDFPDAYGIGTTCRLFPRVTIGADIYTRMWKKFRLNGTEVPEYENTTRYSFGCEVTPTPDKLASFFQKRPWRIGFYHKPWYYRDARGNRPSETFFTMGTSIFFKERRGTLDIALEIGKRGSIAENGAQEWVFRQSLSVVGWERWFQKRQY